MSRADRILEAGATGWSTAHAARAAVLVDAASYFGALRAAILDARRSIFIVGWDVDSRTRLVGESGEPDDGAPAELAALLTHVVRRRRGLRVYVLLWDFSVLYALEREPLPSLNLDWRTPSRVKVCLDDFLPLGASHHQKIAVVDDQLAFCGGLDLTVRRWDTRRHAADDPRRRDPAGAPYGPFHDVQLAVQGEAAAVLGELVRERWRDATGRKARRLAPAGDSWPDGLGPDFVDVQVGVARTRAAFDGQAHVREVEALYRRAIAHAEQSIYIENQYLSSRAVAEALIGRLGENPRLEVVIVGPRDHLGWLEDASMGRARGRFRQRIRENGLGARVRLYAPVVPGGGDGSGEQPVMVHAKLMVVDDRYLQVGSANLNNRSMGLDTECDLGIEADRTEVREAIAAVRDGLLAEHLDCGRDAVAATLRETGSLIATVEALAGGKRRLVLLDEPDEDAAHDLVVLEAVDAVADPERPVSAAELADTVFARDAPPATPETRGRRRGLWVAVAVLVALCGLALAWQLTPLAQWADPERAVPVLQRISGSAWSVVLVPCAYVVGGLLMFPLTVLIAVTAVVYGPWAGGAYAITGAVLSAAAGYGLGCLAGRRPLRAVMGPRLNRASRAIARGGVLAVATVRMVPAAPYTVVNLVAGASHVRFVDYIAGTVLGLAPGIVALAAFGNQLRRLWEEPTPGRIAAAAAVLAGWIVLTVGAHMLLRRRRRSARGS